MNEPRRSPRRRFLTRAALLTGGVAGLGFMARSDSGGGSSPGLPGGALTMELYGSEWHLSSPDRARGLTPAQGERSSSYGRLHASPGGELVGEFYASSFAFNSPFGESPYAAAHMETHTFNLSDGTLVGIGTIGGFHDRESVHAVIGGTGRYAGASGTYVAQMSPLELNGSGAAKFAFDLTLRS